MNEDNDEDDVGNDDGENCVIPTTPDMSRKRGRFPETWKRNREKKARHAAQGFPTLPTCEHGEHSVYKCQELSLQDVRRIHQKYYTNATLETKKNYILQHVTVSPVSRKRTKTPERKRERLVSTEFVLPKQREGVITNVRVCKSAFLSILQEGRDRVQRLCKNYLTLGTTPPESRGGARQTAKYNSKKQAVIDFIKKFKAIQNHYCRGKIKVRQYLPSELSTKKMWRMYVERHADDDELNVDYDFFRNVFNKNFNIGFHAPYSDKCSTCTSLENSISLQRDTVKRAELKLQLLAHKKKADAFYEKLREEKDNEKIFSYDCMKNVVLPKVPDQEAYYRRQLYLYNFTVCEGSSKSNQTKDSTTSYTWLEHKFPKGSVQIASALHHKLINTDWEGITTVRLFSDGCGGQNKNTTVLFMLSYWLLNEAPPHVKTIELCFPVVGHSFIPPDRIFGNLERQFKAHSVIENPEKYLDIIKHFSTVVHLGKDCEIKNWKAASQEIFKKTVNWHFQFQKYRKIILKRNKNLTTALVQGEPYFNFETGSLRSLCKRVKTIKRVLIGKVKDGNHVKEAKISDVKRLLTLHFGEQWEDNPKHTFYKDVFQEIAERMEHGEIAGPEDEEGLVMDFNLEEDDEELRT